MGILHHLIARNFTLLTFLAFTATLAWAAGLPPGETLHDAVMEGRAPDCGGDEFGSPSLRKCNAAISSFLAIILNRGFDLLQTIEFLDTGTVSLFADKYPRQPLTEGGDYHVFGGGTNTRAQKACVLRFFMLEAVENDPNPYGSFLSTYNDFLGAARVLAGTCVQTEGRGGWMEVRGHGRPIAASLSETANVPHEAPSISQTRDYRPNLIDTSLIPYQLPVHEEAESSAVGDQGQGSSTGQDSAQWPMYCDAQFQPSTCEGGGSCSPEPMQQNEHDDERQRIMWGELLTSMLGTCSGGLRVTLEENWVALAGDW